jgi:Tol biopolymer transport system component
MARHLLFRLWLALTGLSLACSPAAADPLGEALALPTASSLTGAADAPSFAWVENAAGVRNIWIGARGQAGRQLTSFAEDDGQQLYGLAFAPDGSRLAFVRGRRRGVSRRGGFTNPAAAPAAPAQQVFVVDADGGTPLLVGAGHSPIFSPDGQRLAFTRRGEIWLWSPGSEARRLAKVDGSVARLTWSPDGTKLLLGEDRGEQVMWRS